MNIYFLYLTHTWIKVNVQGCGNTMPDLSSLSHFPEDKQETSVYLSLDKDFIAEYLDYEMYIFLISLRKHMLWVFVEALLKSTNNIIIFKK